MKSATQIFKNFEKDPSPKNMDSLISWAQSETKNSEIAYLSRILANSGVQLKFNKNFHLSDVASTGGPSSLSTLICPLVLLELGFRIPKLGIQGRPAGGIDVLFQIPDYKIDLHESEITKCINKFKYCHFIVNESFTPLDNILFRYRSINGFKSIVPLVISSLLSKKLAVNIKTLGLDVRVSKFGNFGDNMRKAEKNSKMFIDVASLLGIQAKCFLNYNELLLQPYLGRGESLVALYKIFSGNNEYLLSKHVDNCINMSLELCNSYGKNISLQKLIKNFEVNLSAQGSSWYKFVKKSNDIINQHTKIIYANKSGFIKFNLRKFRDTIVFYQNSYSDKKYRFPDPCGIIFFKFDNDYIEVNEPILSIRAENNILNDFTRQITDEIKIQEKLEKLKS